MDYIDIVFDGPPAHESGRFVEVEDPTGASISVGQWLQRPDGYHVLRLFSLEPNYRCPVHGLIEGSDECPRC